jgi:hypothetical protein
LIDFVGSKATQITCKNMVLLKKFQITSYFFNIKITTYWINLDFNTLNS